MKRDIIILVVILVASTVLGLTVFAQDPGDDAYISFRFAHNLARGEGLTWNPAEPGKRVEGYSNFLWTVLLAGWYALGVSLKTASQLMGLLFTYATVVCLWLAGRRMIPKPRRSSLQWVAPVLYATSPVVLVYAYYGLETNAFGTLVLVCVLAVAAVFDGHDGGVSARRLLGLGVLCALLAMMRAEGVIYAGYLLATASLLMLARGKRGSRLATVWLGFAVLYLPYFFWRYHYYGLVMPLTVYAKAGTYGFWRKGLEYLWEFPTAHSPWLLILAPIGAAWLLREGLAAFKTALLGVLLLCCVTTVKVGHDYMPYGRYMMPILATLFLAVQVAIASVWDELRRSRLTVGLVVCGLAVLALSWINLLKGDWPYRRGSPPVGQIYDLASEGHENAIRFARWLGETVPKDTPVAVRDCGLLPFYGDLQVIDIFGLCNRRVALSKIKIRAQHGPWTDHAVFAHAVLYYKPAYIILTSPDWLDFSDPAVKDNYEFMTAASFSGPTASEPSLYIYRRFSAPDLDIPERFRIQWPAARHETPRDERRSTIGPGWGRIGT